VGKGGIVRDAAARLEAVAGMRGFALGLGMEVLGEAESPVKGTKGNVEYLLHLRRP
jgi:23S rRNA (cytidine1920-2'-O)/16S rRNA (cytidine1409-2'-O)-methyltransferase